MNYKLNSWGCNSSRFSTLNETSNRIQTSPTAEDLSEEMTLAVLPVTILIAVETICGIIGNAFILIVYYRWYKICSFRCFVLSMACIDMISSFTTLPGEIVSQVNWYSYPYNALCKAKSFFNVFTVWASGLVLLLLAYDRFRKICHPLSWQIPVRVSARLCFSCIIFAAVVSSPIAIFWGTQSYEFDMGNYSVSVCICEKADIFAYDLGPFYYILCAFVTPMIFIIVSTVAFNVCTGHKLLQGLRRENGESNCKNGNVTPITNEEKNSFQYSSNENLNGEISNTRRERRFSFPAGKLSLKRRLLMQRILHLSLVDHRLEDIPENDSPPDCLFENGHTKILPKRKRRFYKMHYSDTDMKDSPRSLRRFSAWHNNYLRNKFHRRRRKTLIMLILSGVFVVTMSLYLGLVCLVANTKGTLRMLSNSEKVWFFFFWRLYFINSIINPVLYGFMDHRFRSGLVRLFRGKKYYIRSAVSSNVF